MITQIRPLAALPRQGLGARGQSRWPQIFSIFVVNAKQGDARRFWLALRAVASKRDGRRIGPIEKALKS